VQEAGDVLVQVDEHAELGVAVDRPAVEPPLRQLVRLVPSELEDDVLLVRVTDRPVRRRAADDTVCH
jgi:hypothetical protein